MDIQARTILRKEGEPVMIVPGLTQTKKALELQNRNSGNARTHGVSNLEENSPQFDTAFFLAYMVRRREAAVAHTIQVDPLAQTGSRWLDALGIPAYYLDDIFQTSDNFNNRIKEHADYLTGLQRINMERLNHLIRTTDPEFKKEKVKTKKRRIKKAPDWRLIYCVNQPKTEIPKIESPDNAS